MSVALTGSTAVGTLLGSLRRGSGLSSRGRVGRERQGWWGRRGFRLLRGFGSRVRRWRMRRGSVRRVGYRRGGTRRGVCGSAGNTPPACGCVAGVALFSVAAWSVARVYGEVLVTVVPGPGFEFVAGFGGALVAAEVAAVSGQGWGSSIGSGYESGGTPCFRSAPCLAEGSSNASRA